MNEDKELELDEGERPKGDAKIILDDPVDNFEEEL